MKKLSLLFALSLLLTLGANAQTFQPFKVGLGLGYASPGGKGAKGGVLFYLEPAYRITDVIQAGLRLEGAIVARGFADETEAELEVASIGSYTVNGQYYFNNNNFRPFVGLGLGLYSLAAAEIEGSATSGATGSVDTKAESKFGFYPRVGFDAGHFTLSLDYNIVPETDGIKNNYLGIRIGGFFGGGRK